MCKQIIKKLFSVLSVLGISSSNKDPSSGMQLKVLFPCLKQTQNWIQARSGLCPVRSWKIPKVRDFTTSLGSCCNVYFTMKHPIYSWNIPSSNLWLFTSSSAVHLSKVLGLDFCVTLSLLLEMKPYVQLCRDITADTTANSTSNVFNCTV